MKVKALCSLNVWRKSLVGQLLLRFWICHIIFFTIIGSIQFHSLKDSLYLSAEQNLLSDYQSIRTTLISWLVSSDLPPGRFAELRPGNFVAFYTSESKLRFMVHSYGRVDDEMPAFMEGEPDFNLHAKAMSGESFVQGNAKEGKYMLLVKPLLSIGVTSAAGNSPIIGYAVIGEPLIEEDLILERNIRGYIFNALIVILLSTLLTAYALQKPLEPLLHISSTARRIAGGQYNLRIPHMKTASEIEQLREALNHMLGQMENALNTERTARDRMARFIADASHELRTPLTSIRGFLEILKRTNTTDKETLDSAHNTMLIETERLIRLTEGLLTLNRISQEDITGENQPHNKARLAQVLPELLPLLSSLLADKVFRINGHTLENMIDLELPLNVPEHDIILPLKPDELKQILYNLLNNAIHHTESGGVIEIITKIEKDFDKALNNPSEKDTEKYTFYLSVRDNGRGIKSEDLPHIFERFFRGDRSRSRHKGQGSGLGLAIVSELVRHRGGEIKVESLPQKGTTFTIIFPIA